MEFLTGVNDTNMQICMELDYLDVLNMREVNKYFYELLQKNSFWKMYLYNELQNHHIKPSLLEKYRPQIEPYLLSYRNYYLTKSIDHAVKDNRIDAIIFLKVNDLEPCMWNSQMACKHGNLMALEFFNEEYGILPDKEYLGSEPKALKAKPKRKKDKTYYPKGLVGQVGIVGAHGAVGAYGMVGPVGPIGPAGVMGATGATGPASDKYAIRIAIEKDHVHILDWLYHKGLVPNQNSARQVSYHWNKEAYKWLQYVNQKDNLGLVIN